MNADAYRRDGYVVVSGLIPREEIARLRLRVEELVRSGRSDGVAPEQVQTQYNRAGQIALIKVNQVTDTDPQFRALSHHPEIVDVVESLIGPGARIFRDVLIVKPAHSSGVFSWHQDSAYWDVEPPALVSCWLALTDVTPQSSCLRVVPGSHDRRRRHTLYLAGFEVPAPITAGLRRLVSLAGTGDNPGDTGGNRHLWRLKRLLLARATRLIPRLADLQDYRVSQSEIPAGEIAVTVRAGDAVFFHSLLLHATGPNTSALPRYTPIISFMARDAVCAGVGAAHFRTARLTKPLAA